ncbi:MAG: OadG family protein [Clostridiales bacterium]|nr:OadG family protein [Clostridiales bacterium]MDO4349586.1 OadG family transporter subunit [Eubacteriales bacterium]MDY4007297.1 OadG family transporter subunit [Candidatus Limiplasma sp.]
MEKLIFGLGVMLIGLLVVFIGLIILIGFIKILTMVTTRLGGGKKQKAPAPAPAVEPVKAPAAAPAQPEGVPAEVIAAITAAIASVWQSETGFVVRHVKRITNASVWNRAGREEQTYSRF